MIIIPKEALIKKFMYYCFTYIFGNILLVFLIKRIILQEYI